MTGEEICALAELHTEDLEVDRNIGLTLINECMILDLGKESKILKSQTVLAEKDKWIDLNKPFLEIIEIEKDGKPYYGSKYGNFYMGLFDVREGQIRFPDSGSYTVYGYVLPPPLRDIKAGPAVPPIFHYAIALYVAARIIFMDDEENPNATNLLQQYNYYKQKAIEHLASTRPTTKAPRKVRIKPWY